MIDAENMVQMQNSAIVFKELHKMKEHYLEKMREEFGEEECDGNCLNCKFGESFNGACIISSISSTEQFYGKMFGMLMK